MLLFVLLLLLPFYPALLPFYQALLPFYQALLPLLLPFYQALLPLLLPFYKALPSLLPELPLLPATTACIAMCVCIHSSSRHYAHPQPPLPDIALSYKVSFSFACNIRVHHSQQYLYYDRVRVGIHYLFCISYP